MVKPMAKRFEDILNECIDRMLQGESVEQCLARCPEQARELEPLLRTAQAAREASAIEPRSEFKAQVRYQIHSRFSARGRKTAQKGMPVLGWVPRWAVGVASIFLVVLLAGSSTVAASSTSMPGDTLYPMKLATENVRLSLNRTNMGKARLHVALVDRRIQEIAYLARKGNAERVERIALRLAAHLDAVRRLIELEARRPGRQQAISELKELLAERVASNEALLIQLREGQVSDQGMVSRVLERYRQGWQGVMGFGSGYNG
jgi:hypothetical protein